MLDKFLPPTDNLYKFISISGLLLIVLSFYPSYLQFQLNLKKFEYLERSTILNQSNEDFTREFYKLKDLTQQYSDKGDQLIEKIKTTDPETEKFKNELLEIRKQIDTEKSRLLTRDSELNQEGAKLTIVPQIHSYFENEIFRLNLISWSFFILGFVLIFTGFYYWYVKVQQPNDKLLLKELEETNQNPTTP